MPKILLLVLLIFVAGCSQPTPESMIDNYLSRLSNTLDQDINSDTSDSELPVFPRKRLRAQPTEEIREGLLDVLELRYCTGLLQLIGERNSSLGRVMPPSQRLMYELKFYRSVSDCRARAQQDPNSDQALRDQLEEIYQIKRRNLLLEIMNGILLSAEVEANYSRGEPAIGLTGETGFSASQQAYIHFNTLMGLTADADRWPEMAFLEDFEAHFHSLHSNQYGAKVLKSLILLTNSMNQAADLIETRLQRRAFCFPGHTPPGRQILANVFQNFYGGEFQPYFSRVHREASLWAELQPGILNHPDSPEPVKAYFALTFDADNPDSLWSRYNRSQERHVQAWKQILGQCNMMPGS